MREIVSYLTIKYVAIILPAVFVMYRLFLSQHQQNRESEFGCGDRTAFDSGGSKPSAGHPPDSSGSTNSMHTAPSRGGINNMAKIWQESMGKKTVIPFATYRTSITIRSLQ